MLKIIIGLCILFSFNSYSFVELNIGLEAGGVSFEQNSTNKDEYSSYNFGFQIGTKLFVQKGAICIGHDVSEFHSR